MTEPTEPPPTAHVPAGKRKGRRGGHTFTKHGSHNTAGLALEAANSGRAVGQWLDDAAAEEFIADRLPGLAAGAATFDLPDGVGRQINPDGSVVPATEATPVPGRTGVKTAYPFAE